MFEIAKEFENSSGSSISCQLDSTGYFDSSQCFDGLDATQRGELMHKLQTVQSSYGDLCVSDQNDCFIPGTKCDDSSEFCDAYNRSISEFDIAPAKLSFGQAVSAENQICFSDFYHFDDEPSQQIFTFDFKQVD